MITDRRKLTAKLNPYGMMSSFHFYHWNQFNVIPLTCAETFGVTFQYGAQITALCDTFVITRRRHELYTYSKWELLLGRLLRVDLMQWVSNVRL